MPPKKTLKQRRLVAANTSPPRIAKECFVGFHSADNTPRHLIRDHLPNPNPNLLDRIYLDDFVLFAGELLCAPNTIARVWQESGLFLIQFTDGTKFHISENCSKSITRLLCLAKILPAKSPPKPAPKKQAKRKR